MDKRYSLLAIVSGIFIGLSLVIMSLVTKTVHPFVYSTISTAVAIPMLFVISLFFSGEGVKQTISGNRKEFTTIFLERAIIGGLLLVFGLSMSIAIRSVFVVQLEPLFVFLWSVVLLKESVRKSKVFLILTLLFGAFLLTAGGNVGIFSSFLVGDFLVVLALVFLSHSYLVSANIMKKANAVRLQTGFLVFGLPVFILLALAFQPAAALMVGWDMFILIALSSVFFNVVGFPLWLLSLKRLKPWVLASALVVQSVAGAALSFVWLGQTLSFIQIVGGIIILISVYFISLKGAK